jgi:ELWxxDGT repeat protein
VDFEDDPGIIYNGQFVFAGDVLDSDGNPTGWALCASDGSSIRIVKELDASSPFGLLPGDIDVNEAEAGTRGFAVYNDKLYFFATDQNNNGDLWESDGTDAGTNLVLDNTGSPIPEALGMGRVVASSDKLFFDAALPGNPNYPVLWATDGTTGSAAPVINSPQIASNNTAIETNMIAANGLVFFAGVDANGVDSPWVSDGTGLGTYAVAPGGIPEYFTNVNGTVYFAEGLDPVSFEPTQLWKSDGTAAGTEQVSGPIDGNTAPQYTYLSTDGSTLYFVATSPVTGRELWRVEAIDTSFTGLNAPSIAYGTTSSTISGSLSSSTSQLIPAGESVQVTLDGVTQSALLDSSDSFSVSFETSALNVSDSPYTIAVNYNGDGNFGPATGSSTLAVTPYSFTYQIGNDSQSYGSLANLANDLGTTINTGVNDENLDIAYSSTGNQVTADVSTYALTGVVSDGTGLLSNYSVTLLDGALTVTPYAFTYQIANDSQTYGSPANLANDLGTTINTGVNDENLDIAYSSTGDQVTADVSAYALTGLISDGTGLLSNYSVTLLDGALTVTPYAFTYQIANDSQTYGNPADLANDLGTTINTGVNGENLDIAYSSTGNTSTAIVGSYAITGSLSNGSGQLSDYDVTLSSGTLTVTPATTSVTAGVEGPPNGVLNQSRIFTFTADATANDNAAGFTYSINWGDGSPVLQVPPGLDNTSMTASHAYNSTGSYAVSVTATDQFNNTSPAAGKRLRSRRSPWRTIPVLKAASLVWRLAGPAALRALSLLPARPPTPSR